MRYAIATFTFLCSISAQAQLMAPTGGEGSGAKGGGYGYDNSRRILVKARQSLTDQVRQASQELKDVFLSVGMTQDVVLSLLEGLKESPAKEVKRPSRPGGPDEPIMFDYHREIQAIEAVKGFYDGFAGFGAHFDDWTVPDVEKKILHEILHFSPIILDDDHLAEAHAVRILEAFERSGLGQRLKEERNVRSFAQRHSIALALTRQLLQNGSGYVHSDHVNEMIRKARSLEARVQENLIRAFNSPRDAKRKLQRLGADEASNASAMAVEMIKDSYRDTQQFTEAELVELVEYLMNQLESAESGVDIHKRERGALERSLDQADSPDFGDIQNIEDFYEFLDRPDVDPAYARYLRPAGFDHGRITRNYDRYAPLRKEIADAQALRVAALMAGGTDKYGVLKIQFESENYNARSVAGYDSFAWFKTDSAPYVAAVQAAFDATTGVRVAGVGHYRFETYTNKDLLGTNSVSHSKGGGALIYVVADSGAETKVELLKAMSFRDVEELAHQIRQSVFANWSKEARALQLLIQSLQLSSGAKLQSILQNEGAITFTDVTIQRMTPDEMLAQLPQSATEQRAYLERVLYSLEVRLSAAQERAKNPRAPVDAAQEVQELLMGIRRASEYLERVR